MTSNHKITLIVSLTQGLVHKMVNDFFTKLYCKEFMLFRTLYFLTQVTCKTHSLITLYNIEMQSFNFFKSCFKVMSLILIFQIKEGEHTED